jgi:Fic-DOC domain mobile mystery protein B
MGLELDYIAGQTPINDDDKAGLLIPTISTRGELDEFEQLNIEEAVQWTLSRRFREEDTLSEHFVRELHKRMFGNVWKWAGEFRKTGTNIGVDPWQIAVSLRNLLDDTRYWTANKVFSPDEIALHFKHLLVSIHCFPNGNGRHSRLMADIIVEQLFMREHFSWGAGNLSAEGSARSEYLKAVKAADKGDYSLLSVFARS